MGLRCSGVRLVPTFGANFFRLSVKKISIPPIAARNPFGIVTQGSGRLAVAKLLAHVQQGHSRGEEQARKGMPQIVQAKGGKSRPFQQTVKHSADVPFIKGLSVIGRKQQR